MSYPGGKFHRRVIKFLPSSFSPRCEICLLSRSLATKLLIEFPLSSFEKNFFRFVSSAIQIISWANLIRAERTKKKLSFSPQLANNLFVEIKSSVIKCPRLDGLKPLSLMESNVDEGRLTGGEILFGNGSSKAIRK